ncbi:MAG: hypothetical protein VB049_10400 [Candidatus Pelethousia sp.]|nr:hypothetical protein [Candidatus Pelethousia sp.]
MKTYEISESKKELHMLCSIVKELVRNGEYYKCEPLISDAMGKYPHAPEPHNLIGVLLEKKGDHNTAMKHFRAAWALDPTYIPARQNLESFGTFFSTGGSAFDESDCPGEKYGEYMTEYDEHGIGHSRRK